MEIKSFEAKIKEVRKEGGEKPIFIFRASTDVVDREREIMIPEGCNFENYKKNPVVLWAHLYRMFPIGKCVDIKLVDGGIEVSVTFADTEEGRKAQYLYENGFLNALSVSFNTLKRPLQNQIDNVV